MEEKLYTVNQLTEILGLHPKTIRRYIRNKDLMAQKVGGQWRITESSLESFIDSNQDFKAHPIQKWNEGLLGFVNGNHHENDERIQMATIVDIAVSSEREAEELSTYVMNLINSRDNQTGDIQHLSHGDENRIRFILSGGLTYLQSAIEILERF